MFVCLFFVLIVFVSVIFRCVFHVFTFRRCMFLLAERKSSPGPSTKLSQLFSQKQMGDGHFVFLKLFLKAVLCVCFVGFFVIL